MFLRGSLPVLMSLSLAFGAIAYAQEPQTSVPDGGMRGDRLRHREGRHRDKNGRVGRPGWGGFRGIRELNLTDEQRLQQRVIVERLLEGLKAQREELFKLREKRAQGTFTSDDEARAKALRQKIHNSRQEAHSEIEGILTPEQRTRLDQFKAERKVRQAEILKRRHERRENTPQ